LWQAGMQLRIERNGVERADLVGRGTHEL
jgi:hypothetical protein